FRTVSFLIDRIASKHRHSAQQQISVIIPFLLVLFFGLVETGLRRERKNLRDIHIHRRGPGRMHRTQLRQIGQIGRGALSLPPTLLWGGFTAAPPTPQIAACPRPPPSTRNTPS